MGCCRPLRRVVPAVANRKTAEAGMRHVAQLREALVMCAAGAGAGFVAKARDIACTGVRGCMCEKSAPCAGPCQALAENPSGPRIVQCGQTGVYRMARVNERSMNTLNMALEVLWVGR
jgi:hypothetical protein